MAFIFVLLAWLTAAAGIGMISADMIVPGVVLSVIGCAGAPLAGLVESRLYEWRNERKETS